MADWQDRNDRARALGYRNYYDYRVHDYGRIPPEEAQAEGEELAQLRGHRGGTDLRDAIENNPGSVLTITGVDRGADGRFTAIDMLLTTEEGDNREFSITGDWITKKALYDWADYFDEYGIDFYPGKYKDVFE